MKCPNCSRKIQVSDSREKKDGQQVKRKRFCKHCDQTWTTYEMIHDTVDNNEDIQINSLGTPTELCNKIVKLVEVLTKSVKQ